MPQVPTIQFHSLVSVGTLKRRNELKSYIRKLFNIEKQPLLSLTVVFCSDEYLLSMNQTHLDHDFYTDIITFDLSEEDGPIVGELYISIDRVKDNAEQLGQTLVYELHRVLFHGCLHLCGYGDKTPKEEVAMRAAEDKHLAQYFAE